MKTKLAALTLALAACGDAETDTQTTDTVDRSAIQKVEPGKADTSAEAIILDFKFSGELWTTSAWNVESTIEDQMLYTVGHLNGHDAVGRLDKVELSEIEQVAEGDGTKVTYTAKLQVAWRKSQGVPETYDFILPRDVSYNGKKAFTEAYSHDCVDRHAHDVDTGSMWYYYRPNRSICKFEEGDTVTSTATVTVSDVNTTGKYPEYDKVWEDNVFQVVAVFGKYEDGATTSADAGIRAYNEFARAIRGLLEGHDLATVPADAPSNPGVDVPDIMYSAKLGEDRRIVVYTLMVDNVRTAGAEFNSRYAELSKNADLIIYNGHAGLGANIRSLASKGDWQPGQYAMVFMNGCDTYAYVDSALFDAHARVNEDDPNGTKYVDVITNALPSFFANMSEATMALVEAMVEYDTPRTYEQIFKDISATQVVLVSGEEDNTFVPGGVDVEPVDGWGGVSLAGDLSRGQEQTFETDVLPAGSYTFELTGNGDADLYVRIGLAPSQAEFDCRPYRAGSNETCTLELPAPARIFGMVRGYADQSRFDLTGF